MDKNWFNKLPLKDKISIWNVKQLLDKNGMFFYHIGKTEIAACIGCSYVTEADNGNYDEHLNWCENEFCGVRICVDCADEYGKWVDEEYYCNNCIKN